MDADKQISLHTPCFFYSQLQGYKKIRIAREISAHGQWPHSGFDHRVVDAVTHAVGDLQDHIFFFGATRTDCARVFATMTWI